MGIKHLQSVIIAVLLVGVVVFTFEKPMTFGAGSLAGIVVTWSYDVKDTKIIALFGGTLILVAVGVASPVTMGVISMILIPILLAILVLICAYLLAAVTQMLQVVDSQCDLLAQLLRRRAISARRR